MLPHRANLINAFMLIAMGLWGYFDFAGDAASKTALIPVGFGILFLLATPGLVKENKVIAHVVVLFTLVVILMLIAKPLMSALAADRTMAVVRICLMIATGIFAMVSFIQSFRNARKAREADGV